MISWKDGSICINLYFDISGFEFDRKNTYSITHYEDGVLQVRWVRDDV